MPEIDLHTHSTASDGTFSPFELVTEAKAAGLKAIALTDHDTTSGLKDALQAASSQGLELIPGTELSVDFKPGFMHILGLWITSDAPELNRILTDLRIKRHERNNQIMDKLIALGIPINYEMVKEIAGKGSVGRPHIARLLVSLNYARTINEAFEKFLGDTGKAYIPKAKLTPKKAFAALKNEGATVILAHPYSLNQPGSEEKETIAELVSLGLDGIEAHYSLHSPEQTARYLSYCDEFNLLPTAGSDFHGAVKPDIALGTGRGNLRGDYSILQNLKKRRQKQGLPV